MPEPIYRSRPTAHDIKPASAAGAVAIADGLWMSPGLSNSFLVTTPDGRVIVNTGMGFEGPAHRANFDAVDAGPVRYIVFTQGHYDHVGGADVLRDPETEMIAQANFAHWQADNARLEQFRVRNAAFAWADAIAAAFEYAREHGAGEFAPQSRPVPTISFDDVYAFELGERRFELIATPGGETTDSLVVWLPEERICLCGNLFSALFGHMPNLVTMRGDRYRDALEFIDSLERVRSLEPEVLATGHFDPITGPGLIQSELTRMRDAVQFVHDETVKGMNDGKDVFTLMRDIVLPPGLEVGEGYGKLAWDVRAIWENYAGWFHHQSTTELFGIAPSAVHADLVELTGGPDPLITRARDHLAHGRPLVAIQLAEIARSADAGAAGARKVLVAAHETLLASSNNFWEQAWLRKQIEASAGETNE